MSAAALFSAARSSSLRRAARLAVVGAVAVVTPYAMTVPAHAAGKDHASMSTPPNVLTKPGETHHIGATLTDTDRHAPITGTAVDLQVLTGSGWRHAGWTKTDSRGVAPINIHQTQPGTITLRVYYAGDGGHYHSSSRAFTVRTQGGFGQKVLRVAASKAGAPYQYGAAGPNSFDCSGYVEWVYAHSVGKALPRTAAEQYNASHHIPTSSAQPGDLVAFSGSGGVYHVGIYAGHGEMWDAPHSGSHVQERAIYGAWHAGTFR